MSSDRLQGLADNIRLQTEVVQQYERDVVEAQTAGSRSKIKMTLQREQQQLEEFQQEFDALLPDIEEATIAEIIEAKPSISQDSEIPAELRDLLEGIYAAVTQPEANAALKLKPFLSLTPPFFGLMLEGEFDVESTIQKYFPTFVKLGNTLRSLPKKSQPLIEP